MTKRVRDSDRGNRSRFWLSTTTVGTLVLLLAACSTPGSSPQSSSSDAPTQISFSGKPLPKYNAPAEGIVKKIKDRGTLINGLNAENPPFEYVDTSGKIVGYDVDLTNALAKKLGVKAQNIDTDWGGVIPSLYAGNFDMIWSAMTMTPERSKAVDFSEAYASDQALILVNHDNNAIKTGKDLRGKLVGTQLNSAAEAQALEYEKAEDINYKELKKYPSFQNAYLDLKNGNLDAVTGTKLNDLALFKQEPTAFKVAFTLPYYNYTGVAVRKGDGALVTVVNDMLNEMKKSGELAALQKKWFGFKMNLVQKK